MTTEQPPIMTVDEVAEYLRIPRASVYKLAQQGKIPCQKVGRHWRFRREAVDQWLDTGNQGANPSNWPLRKNEPLPAKRSPEQEE